MERAPGGWAVVHPGSARRWTLAREDAARRYADLGNRARDAARLERTFRRLDAETAPASHTALVAKQAASDLLDAAAAHCFVDPVAATDVVRWNHLRRQAHQVHEKLAASPAAFGALRIEADAPALWAELPEPRHEHLPAWARFREAAVRWLEVHDGRPWIAPAAFPPPPGLPSLPRPGEASRGLDFSSPPPRTPPSLRPGGSHRTPPGLDL